MGIRATGAAAAKVWTIADAARLYQTEQWGNGYFRIAENGNLTVRPHPDREETVELLEVVQELSERNLTTPVIVRFSDILEHRVRQLHQVFGDAIEECGFGGRYLSVYPIKVNQQRQVVEEILRFGESFETGLEAGSKPELLAVLAMTTESPGRLIVCNGFKDDGYVKAGVLAAKLGRNLIQVIENPTELQRILRFAKHYGVRPKIGVRVKLSSTGGGRWICSSGAKSKFGLSISELDQVISLLNREGMLDCLRLIHAHAGSQIPDIQRVNEIVQELARIYTELFELGAENLEYLDVGGGLAVDYVGSQTNSASSMNYSVEEYARTVVDRAASVCDESNVPHPTIVTESGRALVAHHSILIFNVLGANGPKGAVTAGSDVSDTSDVSGDPSSEALPAALLDLEQLSKAVDPDRLLESYHDAVHARESATRMFRLGFLSLPQQARADRLFWQVCFQIKKLAQSCAALPEELLELQNLLSHTYFCNVSVFQSLPDAWAIGQLFPVVPIHRLDEKPAVKAVLGDVTCDSDGKIGSYIGGEDSNALLDLHDLKPDQEYYLGAFLVGAYQETLGDLHNLFGDTHVVHVRMENGRWRIEEVIQGETARQVLSYVHYEVNELHRRLTRECERAIDDGHLSLQESQSWRLFFESELNGYTYLGADLSE